MMKQAERIKYNRNLSTARIFAAAAVILLHTCSTLSENRDIFNMSDIQAVFFSGTANLMRWAVPVFFMITGALLLDPEKEITYKNTLSRYVKRIIAALLIFGIPFAMMKLIMENNGFSGSIIWQSLLCVIENKGLSHLWYLYDLIGIYLILPLLKPFVRRDNDHEILSALVTVGFFDFILPALSLVTGWKIAFHIPLQYPLFYIIAGWYLSAHAEKYPERLLIVVTLLCALTIAVFTGLSFIMWLPDAYDSPLIAVYSICIYCLFLKQNYKVNTRQEDIVWNLDRLCFAVYLIHPVFIQFSYRFLRVTPLISDSLWTVLTFLFWILFTCFSFAGAWILRKIPFFKKYVL